MSNTFVHRLKIEAPPPLVWSVLVDLENWSRWTSTIIEISPEGKGGFAVGSTFLVRQPKLATASWKITSIRDGESFTWTQSRPGLTLIADHSLLSRTETACELRLAVTFAGFWAFLASRAFGKLLERYLEIEAQGLKSATEGKVKRPG